MHLTRLDMRGVRCLASVSLQPDPGLNILLGSNGAGKTSVLEAMHLLGYGRSFRCRVGDGLIRSGMAALEVYGEWQEPNAVIRRAGLHHAGQQWQGRLDGQPVALLSDLCAAVAVLTFQPDSHALIHGPSEGRRRYIDWGLFHVEQDALPEWRRYTRALKQRNRRLKQPTTQADLAAWDSELAQHGEQLTQRRIRYLTRLQSGLGQVAHLLTPALGQAEFEFDPGWKRGDYALADALLLARERDLLSGFTSLGPHRADWIVRHANRPNQEALSRGQAKLSALACLLTQAQDYATQRGHWPIILLDDLASELDQLHQKRLLHWLRDCGAQVFLTGTELPQALEGMQCQVFHVEQGHIEPG